MIDRLNKYQQNPELRQRLAEGFKDMLNVKSTSVNLRHVLLPAGTLLVLGLWIISCLKADGLFLKEALICSSIISGLLFFRAAAGEEKSDREENY